MERKLDKIHYVLNDYDNSENNDHRKMTHRLDICYSALRVAICS